MAADGDLFADTDARSRIAGSLSISPDWAWMRQVHGTRVLTVDRAGEAGEGDGLMTSRPGLPLAVRTADCVPVVVHADEAVAVIHAGWRGLAAGVIGTTLSAFQSKGTTPVRAAIGPAIGPCCYEVKEDVAQRFSDSRSTTTWGSGSVDLWKAAAAQLDGLEVWRADLCTMCEPQFHSFREDGTEMRQTTVGWL